MAKKKTTQTSLFDFASLAVNTGVREVELSALEQGHTLIVGVDEAGRGPLAGPVSAAAVALDLTRLDADWLNALNDSKKLTERRREALFDVIKAEALAWHIASRDHTVIDEINILQATFAAMREAITEVLAQLDAAGRAADMVYIDGNKTTTHPAPQTAVVKGDGRSLNIAAASILAKVSRDRFMLEAHERWPQYQFDRHKGYGTKAHRAAIREHGPSPIQRRSFHVTL